MTAARITVHWLWSRWRYWSAFKRQPFTRLVRNGSAWQLRVGPVGFWRH